jgi:hypothetical protein
MSLFVFNDVIIHPEMKMPNFGKLWPPDPAQMARLKTRIPSTIANRMREGVQYIIWRPHLGHARAFVETAKLQSGQGLRGTALLLSRVR